MSRVCEWIGKTVNSLAKTQKPINAKPSSFRSRAGESGHHQEVRLIAFIDSFFFLCNSPNGHHEYKADSMLNPATVKSLTIKWTFYSAERKSQ